VSEPFAAAAGRLAGQVGAALGWSPDAFWRSTPAEVATVVAALADPAGASPPDAATLARLRKEHPDG
jgi:uncharacterized phage protein (TIGR02216 family)